MIKTKGFLNKSKMFSSLFHEHPMVSRGVMVKPSLSGFDISPQSSYLSEPINNLFLYPEEPISQSVMLETGTYAVQCERGSILIFEKGECTSVTPFIFTISDNEEVFFTFSIDCYKPSLYKSVCKHPYVRDLRPANFLSFPRSFWNSRELSYFHSNVKVPYEIEHLYINGVEQEFSENTVFLGWGNSDMLTELVWVDEMEMYLDDDLAIYGWYEEFFGAVQLTYHFPEKYRSVDGSGQTLVSIYKDSLNHLSVKFRGIQISLEGMVNGIAFQESLGVLTNLKDKTSLFVSGNNIYIFIQRSMYKWTFSEFFLFDSLFVGFNGMQNYLNSLVTEVIV